MHYPADCGEKHNDGCVISAINEQTAVFIDPSTDTVSRREALEYVMHFIGKAALAELIDV